jgi:hypothetical protein
MVAKILKSEMRHPYGVGSMHKSLESEYKISMQVTSKPAIGKGPKPSQSYQ